MPNSLKNVILVPFSAVKIFERRHRSQQLKKKLQSNDHKGE